jgi:phosphoribosylformimino-5-aminoimidazole carboxamide ribotide isomerase
MEVIPAIDLRNGKCVRLYQGDYDRETVFSDDPVAMAIRWQADGAGRLHLVDLDGAAKGKPCNLDAITAILEAVDIPVEVGGGIRTLETIEELLDMGVGRAILGTAAVESPSLVEEACSEFGQHVVIGIDARDGLVATRGWRERSATQAADLAIAMEELGAKRFIYTDISRDGTLTSPNFEATAELVSRVSVPVIAAGGVSSVEHLAKLAALGVEGAIVGRAIYTGDVRLAEALERIPHQQLDS